MAAATELSLHLVGLHGEEMQHYALPVATLGHEFLALVMRDVLSAEEAEEECVICLWHDQKELDCYAALAEQGIGDGARLSCVKRIVTPAEREAVISKALDEHGYFALVEADDVAIWHSLRELALPGGAFLPGMLWPNSLQSLLLDGWLTGWSVPPGLRRLTFGDCFDGDMSVVSLPVGLEELTFGFCFNQSLASANLPEGLRRLTFGSQFDQSLQNIGLPSGLTALRFGYSFNQSIQGVTFPPALRLLAFGDMFNQPVDDVVWPATLETLSFGDEFDQSVELSNFPQSLETLCFGNGFDQSLRGMFQPKSCRH